MFTFMDAARVKLALSTNPPSEVDQLSSLPDCLIFQVFLNLPTKDVVKTSVLSTRWTTLWKDVPGLDLDPKDFNIHETFVSFVDNFLERNRNSSIRRFKLTYDSSYFEEPGLVNRWVETAARLKVEHLDVSDYWDPIMNPTVYTCSSLVSLRLARMSLPNPELVSLPSLKALVLILVVFTNKWALENLISKCPVLENFSIERRYGDGIPILRVHSKSLLTFVHDAGNHEDYDEEEYDEDRNVEIDAPMLKYLMISDGLTSSFIIKSPPSAVEADIDIVFNLTSERILGVAYEVQKIEMVRDFLFGISKVKDMSISSSALQVIYDYARYIQLPVFRNVYTLCVRFDSYMWEMLPVFLEVCPNLKNLVVVRIIYQTHELDSILFLNLPWNLLSSPEHVDIERPLKGEALEMSLVGYLLENSPNLKKLSLSLDDAPKKGESGIYIELLNFPRLSRSCQIIVR
ncbi:unnamed protein product [Brassica napus]|uniref:(rape) hypothetical protein n=1 Tax=Brassica napus TaxID=3708 RepID=A0A816QTX4_BRANA|nr:unnamed protein product [Brassica napus]